MITFENSPVKIGDFYVLANSASISISDPRRGTKSFGEPGFDSQVREGAAVGNVNISYYMTSGDENVRNLFTGNGIQLFDISVGAYQCYSGVANSMSMTIEPYSVVSCTLDMSFYNGYAEGCYPSVEFAASTLVGFAPVPTAGETGIVSLSSAPCPKRCWENGDTVIITWPEAAGPPWSDGIEARVAGAGGPTSCVVGFLWPLSIGGAPLIFDITVKDNLFPDPSDVIHGGASEASTDLLWGTDLASVNYSMAQSISPVYDLGELVPGGYTREGGTIEVGLAGTGWGHIVDSSTLCEGYTTGNISLERLCEECFASEGATGVEYAEGDWNDTSHSYPFKAIEGQVSLPCNQPSCWASGDTVTITWPGGAGAPWSGGITAEIYDFYNGGSCGITYKIPWPQPGGGLFTPPAAYGITVSNDAWGGAPAPPFIIPFSGYVVNPDITVAPNGELNGSLTVFGNLLTP